MKKHFIFVFLVCFAFSASAQYPQASALLGGCVGYMSKTSEVTIPNFDDDKSSSYNIDISALASLNQNWYIGGALGYEGGKETGTFSTVQSFEDKDNFFYIGPRVRYQYGFFERAACFMIFSALYGSGKIEQTATNLLTGEEQSLTDKYSQIAVSLGPGITWSPKPKWGLEFRFGSIAYTSTTYKPDDILNQDDYTESKFKLHLNTDHIRVGAYYMLGNRAID